MMKRFVIFIFNWHVLVFMKIPPNARVDSVQACS